MDRFFNWQLRHARAVAALALLLLCIPLAFVGELRQDTRSDAFLAPDNPALAYRDELRERFGLGDPLIVAVHSGAPQGIYTPETLALVASLTDQLADLENVNSSSVLSLSLEDNVRGSVGGLEVSPFMDETVTTTSEAQALAREVERFPLFVGSLVAQDRSTTLIVLELADESLATQTYRQVRQLCDEQALPAEVTLHVAGEGAVSGYLGDYIDRDAKALNPLAAGLILAVLIIAYRRLLPALFALAIIVASVGGALAAMALSGVPFYVISNALPVILIGISVADAIHVFSQYYDLQAHHPQRSRESLLLETMNRLWRPITVTSLTTSAGFLGLYVASDMPPLRYFGLFTALGVMLAWAVSLGALPAAMLLCRAQVSPWHAELARSGREAPLPRYLGRVGALIARHPGRVLIVAVFAALLGLLSASQLRVDADRITLFSADEPIRVADAVINRHMHGSNLLDVVIETPEAEGLLEPLHLQRIAELQRWAESLPGVGGSTSIVDYLRQINRALHEDDPAAYRLPDSREMAAQYLLLYTFASSPDSLESVIDYDYRSTNLRLMLDSGRYSDNAPVVESLNAYIDQHFNSETLHATVSGRVTLNYFWIRNIADSHLFGLLVTLAVVAVVAGLSFRSAPAGVFALLPVLVAVLVVYSYMVLAGLHLEVGTSMFAAVAIGLGVDFAIHTLARLQQLEGEDVAGALPGFFHSTACALFLNALAIATGFAVLMFSRVSQLAEFGTVVTLAMVSSFVAALVLLPALLIWRERRYNLSRRLLRALACVLAVVAAAAGLLVASSASAQTADEVVANVNAVPRGEQLSRKLDMVLVDKRGRSRERGTVIYRKYFGDERRTVLFFESPANVRGTGFLSFDYAAPDREDDQWLYLPALRKVRRVSAADRGDYFLGTDFSYEDIKQEGRLSEADYRFELAPDQPADSEQIVILATPRSEVIAQELGYSGTRVTVSRANWMVMTVEFTDLKGKPLKKLDASEVMQVDGFWTRRQLVMENLQSGHRSELTFSEVDFNSPIADRLFTTQALARGR